MTDLDNIARGYDELHQDWKGLENIVRENEFKVFSDNAFGVNNVCEIGLGDGVFTKKLTKCFNKVYAVDGSEVTIQELERDSESFKNVEFICSYIETLTMDVKVDNIVMSHILEHVDEPVASLINEKNIMHDDTVLYISVPNAMSLHRQAAVKMGLLKECNELNETDKMLGHRRVYKPDEFKQDLINAGFEILKFGGSMLKPLTNSQIEKNWTPEMISGFIELGNDYSDICGDIYIVAKKK